MSSMSAKEKKAMMTTEKEKARALAHSRAVSAMISAGSIETISRIKMRESTRAIMR